MSFDVTNGMQIDQRREFIERGDQVLDLLKNQEEVDEKKEMSKDLQEQILDYMNGNNDDFDGIESLLKSEESEESDPESVEALEKQLSEVFSKENMSSDDWKQAKNLRLDIAKAKGGGPEELEIALLEHQIAESLAGDTEEDLKEAGKLRIELAILKGGGATEVELAVLENQFAEALFHEDNAKADDLRGQISELRSELTAERNAA